MFRPLTGDIVTRLKQFTTGMLLAPAHGNSTGWSWRHHHQREFTRGPACRGGERRMENSGTFNVSWMGDTTTKAPFLSLRGFCGIAVSG